MANIQQHFKHPPYHELKQKYDLINFIDNKGTVEPYPHIRVDNFYKRGCIGSNGLNKTVFILTHMHADHLGGLSGDEEARDKFGPKLDWNYGKIFCSQVTHRMMILRFPHLE